jgi:lipopolysaccharide heptosyltransferase II
VVRDILLIKQTSLGDVVHATAAIRSVRLAYPKARIAVLTSTTAADVLNPSEDIDDLLTFDRYRVKANWWRRPLWTIGHISKTIKQVRRTRFDIAIDLQGSWKTVIFLWAARTQNRFVKGRWWFAKRFHQPKLHAVDEMEGVLMLSGIDPQQHHPVLTLKDGDREKAASLLAELPINKRKLAIFCPTTRWPTKNWPLQNYLALAEKLKDHFYVVFTGSPDDKAVIDKWIATASPSKVKNLAGSLSLREFFALMSSADLVVTGDSLPMHAASAFGRPLVALFGPTDEALVGPRSKNSFVLRADVNCVRCYRRRSCEKDCISAISIEAVSSAIQKVGA